MLGGAKPAAQHSEYGGAGNSCPEGSMPNIAKVNAFLGYCAGVVTSRYNTNTAKVKAFLGFCAGVITPRCNTDTAKVKAFLGYCAGVIASR